MNGLGHCGVYLREIMDVVLQQQTLSIGFSLETSQQDLSDLLTFMHDAYLFL